MSLAVVFSPQGSQAVGMGRELAAASPGARAAFEEADATLGWSVSATCWEGPVERLNDTRQTQPCLLTTSVAAWRALGERVDLRPAVVAGHSVGEYAALVAAGSLELGAALRIVARRAELMAGVDAEGGMTAILGLEREAVQVVVEVVGRPTDLVVANDNAPGQVVISGGIASLEAAEAALRAAGARRLVRLPVSGAFHSPLMASIAGDLADALEGEAWRDPRVPLVSNVTAEPLTDASRIRALLAEQVRSPVEWVRCVERMVADGVDALIECGSGSALTGMVRRIAPDVRLANVGDAAGLEAAAELVAGAAAPASAASV
jgi:[acyl-carrier-protein] S-malonyltransferase